MTQNDLFDSTPASRRLGSPATDRGNSQGMAEVAGAAKGVVATSPAAPAPALARRTDPPTSHRAAARLQRTGALANQRGAAQRLVDLYGPASASQLAEKSMAHEWARCLDGGNEPHVGLRTVALRKRLPELVAARAFDALFGREQLWEAVER